MNDDERQQLELFVEQMTTANETLEKLLDVAKRGDRLDDGAFKRHIENVIEAITLCNSQLLQLFLAYDGLDLSEWPF